MQSASPPPDPAPDRQPSRRGAWPVLVLALGIILPEMLLWGADAGLWGSMLWRQRAYQYGAFWAGLLHNWRANYALQPIAMFFSYAFLHGGPAHLLGNLGALAWLGPPLAARLGPRRFAGLWLAGALGGAAVFGLLSRSAAPMVGASGALFGLAGAWAALDWRARHSADPRGAARRAALIAAGLLALNLLGWLMEDGVLAWQTHLGGALAGAGVALWMRPPGPGQASPGQPNSGQRSFEKIRS